MKVMRIVLNISTPNTAKAKEFYGDVLSLDLVMDLGWIATYASNETMAPQISIASEGGSGTNVPEISIEVDDLEEALQRVKAKGLTIEYGPAREQWGLRRFYVRDPFGRLVNILSHGDKLAPVIFPGASRTRLDLLQLLRAGLGTNAPYGPRRRRLS